MEYKKITENSINFEGDIIVDKDERIIAWIHESGNIEFALEESEFGNEFVINKKDLKKIVKLL